jgi:hypothetical protein
MADDFLIQLDGTPSFFTVVDDEGDVRGTAYPTCATAFSYEVADRKCRQFRALGFTSAVVADLFGQPVIPADIPEQKYDVIFRGSQSDNRFTKISKILAVEVQHKLRQEGFFDVKIVKSGVGEQTADRLNVEWGETQPQEKV